MRNAKQKRLQNIIKFMVVPDECVFKRTITKSTYFSTLLLKDNHHQLNKTKDKWSLLQMQVEAEAIRIC